MEQRELSLELSLPLLLPPSDLELELALLVCWVSLTMVSALERAAGGVQSAHGSLHRAGTAGVGS